MVLYNFKSIQVVPNGNHFINIVLSKTQRKTPTVVHPNYNIARIRSFYMRKVKFTQEAYHEKLTKILQDFPMLDDVHPFYASLMNVLYDKDHYKLALGQLNTTRHLLANLGKDYLRLLKYGDSLYRCKQLKRAALGRMCTIMKKQSNSLAYLEQVRQHLARLPSIDPNTRTLILCGYPNVGKSSFMNKVTRANVEVQPYAFTTKSLFVGHFDYRYLRWQILDTPGILDAPLEERNTIEMQSITALASLRAGVLYLIDISEQCGYSIDAQVKLFHSIMPLFNDKPVLVVLNKTDVRAPTDLSVEHQRALKAIEEMPNVSMLTMSTLTDTGVAKVKEFGCDAVLAMREEAKLASASKNLKDNLNRLHVALPKPRDSVDRAPEIPASVATRRAEKKKEKKPMRKKNAPRIATDDDDDDDNDDDNDDDDDDAMGTGGARRRGDSTAWKEPEATIRVLGSDEELDDYDSADDDPTVFGPDFRAEYALGQDDWKWDAIPEILDGKNIHDYVDEDILDKLKQLEHEEEERFAQRAMHLAALAAADDDFDIDPRDRETIRRIREKKALAVQEHRLNKVRNATQLPKKREKGASVDKFAEHLKEMGYDDDAIDSNEAVRRARSRSRRERSQSRDGADADGAMDGTEERGRKRQRSETRSVSVTRSRSRTPAQDGVKDVKQLVHAERLRAHSQKRRNKEARRGEGDRHVPDLKPKHLFSGKRGVGKTDRR